MVYDSNASSTRILPIQNRNKIVTLVNPSLAKSIKLSFATSVDKLVNDPNLLALQGFQPITGRKWKYFQEEKQLIIQVPNVENYVYKYSYWSKDCYVCDDCHRNNRSSKVFLKDNVPAFERNRHLGSCIQRNPCIIINEVYDFIYKIFYYFD